MRQLLMISGLASILMTGVAAAPTFAQTAPPQGGQAGTATPAAPSDVPGRPPVAGDAKGQDQGSGNGPRGPASAQARPGFGGPDFGRHGFDGRGFAGHGPFGHPPFPGAFPPPMRPGLPFEGAAGMALAAKLSVAETYVGVTSEQLDAWRAYTTALIDFAEPPEAGGRDQKAAADRLPGEGMADGLIAAAEKAKALKAAIDALKKALQPEQLHRLSEIAPTLTAFGPPPGLMASMAARMDRVALMADQVPKGHLDQDMVDFWVAPAVLPEQCVCCRPVRRLRVAMNPDSLMARMMKIPASPIRITVDPL